MGPVSAAAAQWGVDSALAAEAHRSWSAQTAFVVKAEGSHIRSQRQVAVAHGRITRFPIKPSTAASVCTTQLPSAPLAIFSFAAIS